ncbi:MAG: alpha/beta hydrolase [Nitrospinae bacterium]|nr:alpha/beta hydrolase [Nitrospinota bacterium]
MVVKAVRNIPWFTYFPDNYRWSFIASMGLMRVAGGGADTSEIFEVCRNLDKNVGSDEHWFEEWKRMGDRIRAMGVAAQRRGKNLTAAGHFCRSSTYHQMADRFRFPKDRESQGVYRKSIDSFKRFVRLNDRPKAEIVEIPYEGGKSLPGYFVHAENTRKSRPPVVVLYSGFDGTKESPMIISAGALARRGMSVVVVDSPGVGEAIRFRKIFLRHDYEVAGSAILDWLEKRKDVNAKRAGIMASSLGGYYAPRTASMERRFKACLAHGAIWDYHAIWKRRIEAAFRIQLPSPGNHLAWSFNVKTAEEGLAKLEGFRLDGVVQRMKCPFLIVHGEDDQQIPLADAKSLYRAAGSKDKTLRVYKGTDGGSQHCHMDYIAPVVGYMADWMAEKLGA